jgi:hypothetical protein
LNPQSKKTKTAFPINFRITLLGCSPYSVIFNSSIELARVVSTSRTAVQHELAVGQGNSRALRTLVVFCINLLSGSEPVSLSRCR